MKCLSLSLFLVLSACGSAQLISTRYEPIKQGTVKVDWDGPIWRDKAFEDAKRVMANFCRPDQYKIVGTDQASQIEGAYASPVPYGGVQYGYKESPLIHFRCEPGRDSASDN